MRLHCFSGATLESVLSSRRILYGDVATATIHQIIKTETIRKSKSAKCSFVSDFTCALFEVTYDSGKRAKKCSPTAAGDVKFIKGEQSVLEWPSV